MGWNGRKGHSPAPNRYGSVNEGLCNDPPPRMEPKTTSPLHHRGKRCPGEYFSTKQ